MMSSIKNNFTLIVPILIVLLTNCTSFEYESLEKKVDFNKQVITLHWKSIHPENLDPDFENWEIEKQYPHHQRQIWMLNAHVEQYLRSTKNQFIQKFLKPKSRIKYDLITRKKVKIDRRLNLFIQFSFKIDTSSKIERLNVLNDVFNNVLISTDSLFFQIPKDAISPTTKSQNDYFERWETSSDHIRKLYSSSSNFNIDSSISFGNSYDKDANIIIDSIPQFFLERINGSYQKKKILSNSIILIISISIYAILAYILIAALIKHKSDKKLINSIFITIIALSIYSFIFQEIAQVMDTIYQLNLNKKALDTGNKIRFQMIYWNNWISIFGALLLIYFIYVSFYIKNHNFTKFQNITNLFFLIIIEILSLGTFIEQRHTLGNLFLITRHSIDFLQQAFYLLTNSFILFTFVFTLINKRNKI